MAKVTGYDPQLKKECKCRNCSAIVEYTLQEVKFFDHYDYGGGSDRIYYINCPGCSDKIQNVKHY